MGCHIAAGGLEVGAFQGKIVHERIPGSRIEPPSQPRTAWGR